MQIESKATYGARFPVALLLANLRAYHLDTNTAARLMSLQRQGVTHIEARSMRSRDIEDAVGSHPAIGVKLNYDGTPA